MTLVELQEKLGEQIALVTDERTSYEARKKLAEVAQIVSSLAKQMINNADVVLRAEKLISEGKLQGSSIEQMIGNDASKKMVHGDD